MSACVPITNEQIRAEVWMGDSLLISKTPFIKSFNVSSSRNQISSTFNVTFEILGGVSFPLGENLVIKAGTRGNLKQIFSGDIENTTARPAFGKPSYFSVTLSGRGVLSRLENKKFSRRLKTDGQGMYCLITGGATNRPKDYTSLSKKTVSGNQVKISSSPNPADKKESGEHSPYNIGPDTDSKNDSGGGLAGYLAGKPSGGGTASGEFKPHTHEDLDEGGPAFGVYSSS